MIPHHTPDFNLRNLLYLILLRLFSSEEENCFMVSLCQLGVIRFRRMCCLCSADESRIKSSASFGRATASFCSTNGFWMEGTNCPGQSRRSWKCPRSSLRGSCPGRPSCPASARRNLDDSTQVVDTLAQVRIAAGDIDPVKAGSIIQHGALPAAHDPEPHGLRSQSPVCRPGFSAGAVPEIPVPLV